MTLSDYDTPAREMMTAVEREAVERKDILENAKIIAPNDVPRRVSKSASMSNVFAKRCR